VNALEQYDEKIRNLVSVLGKSFEEIKWTEEQIKEKMINLREETKLSRKEMTQFFQILYQIFLGNTRGPRFAPFIAALDKDWVMKRLQEV
jgi:lysyl-tRNA synthetase class 1